jgi:hypothetical protein
MCFVLPWVYQVYKRGIPFIKLGFVKYVCYSKQYILTKKQVYASIDNVMKNIKTILEDKYYRYNPGEFLPIYEGNTMVNKKQFHAYRIKWILQHRDAALYQFTHFSN